jgi:hypothetical protein
MRFWFFILCCCVIITNVDAQRTFRAGVQAGINGCQIHGDSYSGFNAAGPVAGVSIAVNPDKKLHWLLEFQYAMKGSRKIAYPEKGDYDAFQLRLNYVELPLLVRYQYKDIYFQAGWSFGVLAKVREWDDFGEVPPRDFQRFEHASILGIGYQINEFFAVDMRMVNSMLPIKKFAVPLYYQNRLQNLFNRGMYNNILGLTVTYRLPGRSRE